MANTRLARMTGIVVGFDRYSGVWACEAVGPAVGMDVGSKVYVRSGTGRGWRRRAGPGDQRSHTGAIEAVREASRCLLVSSQDEQRKQETPSSCELTESNPCI